MRDPKLLQAGPQRIGVQAQDPSRAPRTLDDAVRFCKDTDDVGPLHVLEARGGERWSLGGSLCSRASSISTMGPRARIAARSITLCNSPTLPDQE